MVKTSRKLERPNPEANLTAERLIWSCRVRKQVERPNLPFYETREMEELRKTARKERIRKASKYESTEELRKMARKEKIRKFSKCESDEELRKTTRKDIIRKFLKSLRGRVLRKEGRKPRIRNLQKKKDRKFKI